jgi:hypothetical protein
VLVEPSPIDRRGIGKRLESSDGVLTPPELVAIEPRPSEEQGEQSEAEPRGSAEVDGRRKGGATAPQPRGHRDVFPVRSVRPREVCRNRLQGLPDRIERQVDRIHVDRPFEIGQAEVVIEQVQAAARDQDVRVGVLEKVGDLVMPERGIGGETAPPPQRLRSGPRVIVDLRQRLVFVQRDQPARLIDAAEAIEVDLVLQARPEDALTAIPVAVEHDGMPLPNVKPSVGVETGGDRQPCPSQRARVGGPVRSAGDHEQRDENRPLHVGGGRDRLRETPAGPGRLRHTQERSATGPRCHARGAAMSLLTLT